LVKAFKKALFGAKSERIAPDQYELSLEDIETGIALVQAEIDADERVEVVVEPDSTTCSCGHERHVISEDFSERLDIVPAQFHVIVTRRPSYACRACEGSFTQALTFAILPT
jgi:transposase